MGPSQYHGAMICLVLRRNPVCPPRISCMPSGCVNFLQTKGEASWSRSPLRCPGGRSSDPMSQGSLKSAKPQAHKHSCWLPWLHVDSPWPPPPPWGGGLSKVSRLHHHPWWGWRGCFQGGWLCVCVQDPDGGGDAGGPCPASFVTSRLVIFPSWVLVVSRHPPWGVYRASLAKPALKMICFVQIRLLPPSEVLCESRKG